MKSGKFFKITTAALIVAMAAGNANAGKGGNKDKDGDDSGGFIDAVFIVDSSAPSIPPVASNSADSKGQIVFYAGDDTVAADGMDLSLFEGSYDSGTPCSNGFLDGIIVIYPQSTRNPGSAELIFWYRDDLESGDEVTHLLTMQGTFDDPTNWPPSEAKPQTTITLNYWEFAAENRKAQRQDCSGSSDFPVDPWTVTVTRVVP